MGIRSPKSKMRWICWAMLGLRFLLTNLFPCSVEFQQVNSKHLKAVHSFSTFGSFLPSFLPPSLPSFHQGWHYWQCWIWNLGVAFAFLAWYAAALYPFLPVHTIDHHGIPWDDFISLWLLLVTSWPVGILFWNMHDFLFRVVYVFRVQSSRLGP